MTYMGVIDNLEFLYRKTQTIYLFFLVTQVNNMDIKTNGKARMCLVILAKAK